MSCCTRARLISGRWATRNWSRRLPASSVVASRCSGNSVCTGALIVTAKHRGPSQCGFTRNSSQFGVLGSQLAMFRRNSSQFGVLGSQLAMFRVMSLRQQRMGCGKLWHASGGDFQVNNGSFEIFGFKKAKSHLVMSPGGVRLQFDSFVQILDGVGVFLLFDQRRT